MEEPDRLSELPADVLDKIMGLLWIGEAARCAVLSTALRDAWYNLTELDFDDSFHDNIYSDCGDDPATWNDTINNYLKKHNGSIKKFGICFSLQVYQCDFDKLFVSVTKKGVQELYIEIDSDDPIKYRLPACIFKCPTLKIVQASGVKIDPIKARCIFPNVTSISFSDVDFSPRSPQLHVVDVPMLRKLIFSECKDISHFNITAPKLRTLSIKGCYIGHDRDSDNGSQSDSDDDDYYHEDDDSRYANDYRDEFKKRLFEFIMSQVQVTIHYANDSRSDDDECDYNDNSDSGGDDDSDMFCYDPLNGEDKSGGGFLPANMDLGSICALHLCCDGIGAVVDDFRIKPQMPVLDVTYLNLSGDYSPDSDSNSKFVSLLRSCPKLCKLVICFQLHGFESPDCSGSFSDHLEGHQNLHYRHNALQFLKLSLFSGSKSELQFITGLIACFPTCKKVLVCCPKRFRSREKAKIKEEILSSCGASSAAKIYLK
ncbi:unnamed protein product [Cuscuta epithymum]|uniref:F-box/LRR-repeat protein 15/At3g58940/PEG3-like LRR domain-containing protein n=1 Tax=Cuscuta epithymum TaxID=186058 RepID=A0AAV0FFU7_9ASTE|nr:unnamed protein product [Cuscuta epithymum]